MLNYVLLLQCLLYMNPNIGLDFDIATQNCFAFYSGTTTRFCNRVCNRLVPTDSEIVQIKAFFGDIPFTWFVYSADVETLSILQKNGLKHKASLPAMILNLDLFFNRSHSDEVIIKEIDVTGIELEEWILIASESFHTPQSELLKAINRLKQKAAKRLKLYLGFYKGKAAATCMVIQHQEVVTLHWISTSLEFRNKGIGSIITSKLLFDSKELGFKKAILISSDLGRHLYERIGFTQYAAYDIYGNY